MTVMNFERHGVQRYFEALLGCTDITQWKSYKPALAAYTLSANDVAAITPLLVQDAEALYIKALQTFSQALAGIHHKEFAWAIVKMYYSVFYAMRCELHASSVIAVKNGSIFYTTNVAGSAFSSIQEKGSHQTYIKLRKTLPASVISHDTLLDNDIEAGVDVYSWMCFNRERVNYHSKHFADPEPDDVLAKIYNDYVLTHKTTDLLNLYESDLLYCFDTDHATVAVPYRKLRTCRDLLYGRAAKSASEQMKFDNVRAQLLSLSIDNGVIDRLML